ncbi:MAG: TRAP transporter small permease [Acidobacteriota bacterium]
MTAALGGPAGKALAGIDRVAGWAVIAAACAMTAIVFTQVVLRYGFNTSIDWAEEVARLTFVWFMFLAVPLGVRGGAHIGIEFVMNAFPEVLRQVLPRLMAGLSAFLMGVVCWHSVVLLVGQWDENLPTLEVSVGWFMLPIAIGAAHSILHLVAIAVAGAPRHDLLSAE